MNLKPISLLTKNSGLNLVELQIKCITNSIKLIQYFMNEIRCHSNIYFSFYNL